MNIKMLVMDVDGTLTDGKIYMGTNGELMKAFDVKDGYAIAHLRDYDIEPVIITGRESKIVENRSKELGINELYQLKKCILLKMIHNCLLMMDTKNTLWEKQQLLIGVGYKINLVNFHHQLTINLLVLLIQ